MTECIHCDKGVPRGQDGWHKHLYSDGYILCPLWKRETPRSSVPPSPQSPIATLGSNQWVSPNARFPNRGEPVLCAWKRGDSWRYGIAKFTGKRWLDVIPETANEEYVPPNYWQTLVSPDSPVETPTPQSPIAFPRAWGCDAANGWTIDPTLLIAIHDEISGEEFATSQEGVELVLLAYERIAAKAPAGETREPDRAYLLGLLHDWFRHHKCARGPDGRLLHPDLDVETQRELSKSGSSEKAAPPLGELRAEQERTAVGPSKLEFALRGFYWDQVDYLTLNKLGGMNNHWMRAAREALGMDPNGTRLRAEQEEVAPFTLRDFGYAPGSYSCICFSCGGEFVGDKRAMQCEPCATKKLAQSRAKQPVAHHDGPDDETKREDWRKAGEQIAAAIPEGRKP